MGLLWSPLWLLQWIDFPFSPDCLPNLARKSAINLDCHDLLGLWGIKQNQAPSYESMGFPWRIKSFHAFSGNVRHL